MNLRNVSFQLCSFFTPKIILAILVPLQLCVIFRISLSVSAKKPVGILMGTVSSLQINLRCIAILPILSSNLWMWKYLSIYLVPLKFIQQCIVVLNISYTWLLLNLFLGVLFFWCHCKWNCFLNFILGSSVPFLLDSLYMH